LEVGDRLVGVDITDGSKHIMLSTASGKPIRFGEDDVRQWAVCGDARHSSG
jgi:DNA gyrase subunit A